jgi:hypothetical protein
VWLVVLFPATTVPDPSKSAGAIGTLPKHPSLDSAYDEGGKVILYWQRNFGEIF